MYGTFDGYSGHDALNDLRNGWLKLGPRDDAGVPVWACVVRELDRKQPVSDFTGGRMTLSPGILYCTRMAFSDEIAAVSILDQLCAYLDVRKPHTAVNMGDTPRIHLVVDCYANTATVEMLHNARPAPLDGSTEEP